MSLAKKTLGRLLADTVLLIKENILSLTGIVAVAYIPLGCLFLLFFWTTVIFKDSIDVVSPHKNILAIMLFFIFFVVVVTIAFLAMMIFSIAIIKKIKACDDQENLSIGETYRLSAAVLGSFCIVIFWAFIKVSLWSLLLIVPGIVFAIFYSFAQMAFILDEKKGISALVFSRGIIQSHFWEFVGKSFVASLIFFVFSMVFGFFVYRVFPSKSGWDPIISGLLQNLINGFLGIFPLTFGYFLYKDLKERDA